MGQIDRIIGQLTGKAPAADPDIVGGAIASDPDILGQLNIPQDLNPEILGVEAGNEIIGQLNIPQDLNPEIVGDVDYSKLPEAGEAAFNTGKKIVDMFTGKKPDDKKPGDDKKGDDKKGDDKGKKKDSPFAFLDDDYGPLNGWQWGGVAAVSGLLLYAYKAKILFWKPKA